MSYHCGKGERMKRPRPPAEPVRCLLSAILMIGLSLGLSCSSGCRPADPAAAGGSKADQKDSGQSGGPSGGEETSSEAAQRSPAADAPLTNLTSAQQVLDAMVAAYRNARTYSDRGTLRLQETSGGQKQDRATDYAIVLERPNKLRMHALRGVVVCDGKEFHAHFPELPDQLVTRPAPARNDDPVHLERRDLQRRDLPRGRRPISPRSRRSCSCCWPRTRRRPSSTSRKSRRCWRRRRSATTSATACSWTAPTAKRSSGSTAGPWSCGGSSIRSSR